jgi:TRAP-type C4-dicarboxylate transport system permease small subunit
MGYNEGVNIMRGKNRFYFVLDKSTRVVIIFLLSVLTVIVPVEVLLRYVFGKSLIITEELTRYVMVWVVFLASSLALKENLHINILVFVDKFHGRTRSGVSLLGQLLLLIFLLILIVEGIISLSFQMDQISPTLGIPLFWFYLAIPVGSALMIINLLPTMWKDIKIILNKQDPTAEGKFFSSDEEGKGDLR